MIPKSVLRTVVLDQLAELGAPREYVQREIFPEVASYAGTAAFVIKGVRRCGKSTLMTQLMKTKFKDNFLYFNFDDERVAGLKSEDLQSLMETLIEVAGDKKNLFFDEIQNVAGWELFINRLLRHGYKVFITGSNANLLSKELGTHMTGRHIDIELYPFSFLEFLKAKKIEVNRAGFYSTQQKAMLLKAFKEYMQTGGMPEAVVFSNETLLTQLVNDIMQKDIMSRYSIRKPAELKAVLRFLIANASNPITYRSIVDNFGIQSPNTVQKYIAYAKEAYLIFEVGRFERKLRKLDKNPKKVYCIDNGILVKNAPAVAERMGAILENMVAVQLKRLGNEFYYYKSIAGWEVDFVVPAEKAAIQVCLELNQGNMKREVRGLEEAMRETGAEKAMILTLEQEQEIESKVGRITVKPAWQWLLESWNKSAKGGLL